jgi:hypothetical protein
MTQGIKTFGAKLYIGDGSSPEDFTQIEECFSYGPVGGSKSLIDFSNHDSIGFNEYQVADLKEGKDIKIECNHVVAAPGQILVRAADAANSVDNWLLLGRDHNGYIFPAIITDLETDYSDMKGRVVFRFTLKPAGNVETVSNYSPA